MNTTTSGTPSLVKSPTPSIGTLLPNSMVSWAIGKNASPLLRYAEIVPFFSRATTMSARPLPSRSPLATYEMFPTPVSTSDEKYEDGPSGSPATLPVCRSNVMDCVSSLSATMTSMKPLPSRSARLSMNGSTVFLGPNSQTAALPRSKEGSIAGSTSGLRGTMCTA